MLFNITDFLLSTAEFLIVYPALLRFYLQAMRVPPRNQITDFVVAFTNFAVKPLRRVIPGINGLDMASLIWALLAETLLLIIFKVMIPIGLAGGTLMPLSLVPVVAMFKIIVFSIQLLIFVIIVQAIMSFVAPYNPLRTVFDTLIRPFVAPLQRFIKPIGRFDLSSLLLLIICQILLIVINNLAITVVGRYSV